MVEAQLRLGRQPGIQYVLLATDAVAQRMAIAHSRSVSSRCCCSSRRPNQVLAIAFRIAGE